MIERRMKPDVQNIRKRVMVNSDVSEGISDITWSVYGKITGITKTDGAVINYSYDAMGNRISKTYKSASDASPRTTWYVRDASGNVMSVYEKEQGRSGGDLVQSEVHVYGSGRLGIYEPEQVVEGMQLETGYHSLTRGKKLYELSNHLGNVLATISDKKVQHDNGSGQVDYYNADVVTANDYYPFGMQMPGRSYTASFSGYRYGFNGKEKDNKDGVVQYDYGFRIYDPRLVRFKSVDPLSKNYAMLTPYQFASNTPIQAIDLDGAERLDAFVLIGEAAKGEVLSNNQTYLNVTYDVQEKALTIMTGKVGGVGYRFDYNTDTKAFDLSKSPVGIKNIQEKYGQVGTKISKGQIKTINSVNNVITNLSNLMGKDVDLMKKYFDEADISINAALEEKGLDEFQVSTRQMFEGFLENKELQFQAFDKGDQTTYRIFRNSTTSEVKLALMQVTPAIEPKEEKKKIVTPTVPSNTPVSDHPEDTQWKKNIIIKKPTESTKSN